MRPTILIPVLALLLVAPADLDATWSIVVVDSETKEVAIGSVTCLTSFDLLALTPVVLVGVGGAAVQAAGDFNGIRRPIIRQQLLLGTDPEEILAILATVAGHQQRQYGIVDTLGRAVTFSGNQNFQWAGGVTGESGSMVYAIQGNILAGSCVVPAMVDALVGTDDDIPGRLMAAMLAARAAGGDGRCSCSQGNPTGCGCPPSSFTKSGHIGYMVSARAGDIDDPTCTAGGCADGDYFMKFNVAFQSAGSLDPVLQLRNLFEQWRQDLVGRPDAIASQVSFSPAAGGIDMTIELRDWQGLPVTVPVASLTVAHHAESDGISEIGVPQDLGGGVYSVTLTSAGGVGLDVFQVTANDGIRPVILMPPPRLCVGEAGPGIPDCNGNGMPDSCDIAAGASLDEDGDGVPDECPRFLRGDCNPDGVFDIADPVRALTFLFLPGLPLACESACDTNDDEALDVADAIYSLEALFTGGPPPPPPFPGCAAEGTGGSLECAGYPPELCQ
ncbi:MAG: DUF1028 domain-containing protein [Planctomycetota bacterium]